MNPEQVDNTVLETTEKHPVFKVTVFSKYLAMILFVILPFLGAYVGYTYSPLKVIEIEKVVVKEIPVEKFTEESEVQCFWSKDYFVVAPKLDSEYESIIVKDRKTAQPPFTCEYKINQGDIEIKRDSWWTSVATFANSKLYITNGVGRLRGFNVYDLKTGTYVLKDKYFPSDLETSADYVRYWTIADNEMSSDDCLGIDFGPFTPGLDKYVEYNFVTSEMILIEKRCQGRE